MARIIVNLVSRETTPNFLFIKEMKQKDDALLFITSKIFEERIQWIEKALNLENCHSKPVVLDNGIEEKWSQMVSSIRSHLSDEHQYIVNLTCGTKYMISAVPKAFEGFDAEFFYIPFPKNIILKIDSEESKPITYRMSVKEYFYCNNTQIPNCKTLTQSEEYTKKFFKRFTEEKLDFKVIDLLRSYREKRTADISKIESEGIPQVKETLINSFSRKSDVENNTVEVINSSSFRINQRFLKENSREYPKIEGLSSFLKNIGFNLKTSDKLSKYETQYLTGGWFEEYVYSVIKAQISPDDIALGVGLPITDNKQVSNRDLDVVFTFENKLFVIECKTGIEGEKMLAETVYKVAALKNERLGKLSAYTSIYSLSDENEKFSDIAKAMNITYYDKSYFVADEQFKVIILDINKKAKG